MRFLPTQLSHRRSEEHTSELQSLRHLVCRLLLEKKKWTHGSPGMAWPCAIGRANVSTPVSSVSCQGTSASAADSGPGIWCSDWQSFIFFNDTATTEIYTLSLHDAFPIYHKQFSHELGRDMESLVYGHAGHPVLVFPTSMGRFFEYEDAGMIRALRSEEPRSG